MNPFALPSTFYPTPPALPLRKYEVTNRKTGAVHQIEAVLAFSAKVQAALGRGMEGKQVQPGHHRAIQCTTA